MKYSNLVKQVDDLIGKYGYWRYNTEIKKNLIKIAQYNKEIIDYFIEIIENSHQSSNEKSLMLLEVLIDLEDNRAISYLLDLLSSKSSENKIDIINLITKMSEKKRLNTSTINEILKHINWDELESWHYRQMIFNFCKSNHIDGILNKIAEIFIEDKFRNDNIRIEILNYFLSTNYDLSRFLPRIKRYFDGIFVSNQDGEFYIDDLTWEILRFISKIGNDSEIPFFMKVFYKLKEEFENYLVKSRYNNSSPYYYENDDNIKPFTLSQFFEQYHIFYSILIDFSKKLGYSSAMEFIETYTKQFQSEIQQVEQEKNNNRILKLKNVHRIFNEITFIRLAKMLDFKTEDEFLKWLVTLNLKSYILIEGEKIVFLKEGQPKGKYSCFNCGNPISRNAEFCSECNEKILVCSVCKLPVNYVEDAGKCSLCEAKGHLNHLQEHVKVYGKCPICGRKIPPEGIVPIDIGESW